ncbi:MAG TPA: hypothetical protein VF183_06655, partial [Acidimicrobiales bacterium]
MARRPARDDERPHRPGDGADWHEVFELGFGDHDGSIGGSVVVALQPHEGVARFWAAIVGRDRPLVTVYDDELPLPRDQTLELRTSGLWVDVELEAPYEHVTVGLEAFGLVFDDPDAVLGVAHGDRLPVGIDLEWESDPSAVRPQPWGYDVLCRVHGDVLLGSSRVPLDGWGWRAHGWGSEAAAALVGVHGPDAAAERVTGASDDVEVLG